MKNLVAYIPTLNQRHVDWFKKHQDVRPDLFLISQDEAEAFLPRLNRHKAALPTHLVAKMIRSLEIVSHVIVSSPDRIAERVREGGEWVLANEDVSHLFADKYLRSTNTPLAFDETYARYDMSAVIREQPIIPDIEISEVAFHRALMEMAMERAGKSPDWWRSVGALVENKARDLVAIAHNVHLPNEYETYVFGDPALYRDAGQKGKSCSLHAERAVIALCAKHGHALEGGQLFSTVFPCEDCAREIAFAGIQTVFFRDGYSALNALDVFRTWGVKIVQVK